MKWLHEGFTLVMFDEVPTWKDRTMYVDGEKEAAIEIADGGLEGSSDAVVRYTIHMPGYSLEIGRTYITEWALPYRSRPKGTSHQLLEP